MNEELKKKLTEAKTAEEKRAILNAFVGELTDEQLAEISGGGCSSCTEDKDVNNWNNFAV